MIFNVLNN